MQCASHISHGIMSCTIHAVHLESHFSMSAHACHSHACVSHVTSSVTCHHRARCRAYIACHRSSCVSGDLVFMHSQCVCGHAPHVIVCVQAILACAQVDTSCLFALHPFASVCIRLHPFRIVCNSLNPFAHFRNRLHAFAPVCFSRIASW